MTIGMPHGSNPNDGQIHSFAGEELHVPQKMAIWILKSMLGVIKS